MKRGLAGCVGWALGGGGSKVASPAIRKQLIHVQCPLWGHRLPFTFDLAPGRRPGLMHRACSARRTSGWSACWHRMSCGDRTLPFYESIENRVAALTPEQVIALDRHRERQLKRISRRLREFPRAVATEPKQTPVEKFYGHPFSYFGQFCR